MSIVKRTMVVLFCHGLWFLTLLGGFFTLLKYEFTPGAATESPNEWPRDSTVSRTAEKFMLVMAAHPRCPCTRVSIEELRRVLERSLTPVDVQVLFFKPLDSDWAPTDLWRQAVAIPGVHANWDEDGIEAARFGAQTSGHALLFDPTGRLLFSGGITSGRGHSGPSKGNLSLAAWLTPGETGPNEALVFGCALNDPQSPCPKGTKACQRPQ
jgi:hypothetical protein